MYQCNVDCKWKQDYRKSAQIWLLMLTGLMKAVLITMYLFNIYTCCAASMLLARVETKWSTFIYAWCVLHIAFKYFTLYIYNWIHGVHLQDNPRWDTIFMLSATEFLPFLAKQDWQDKLLIMKHKCFGETWVLWNCTKITKM